MSMMRAFLIVSLILTGCYTQIENSQSSSTSYLPHRESPSFRAESVHSKGETVYPDSGFYYRFKTMSELGLYCFTGKWTFGVA